MQHKTQKQPVHILGIPGSLRQNSYNRALLQATSAMLPSHAQLTIFDLHEIPLFNTDIEAKGIPEPVRQLRQHLQQADALLIATPEYNYSIPGVLKNALDWASRAIPDPSPLNNKPVGIMGVGGGLGTVRAQMHLRDILLHNSTYVMPQPQLMIARGWEHFDQNGNLISERYRQSLNKFITAFLDWVYLFQPAYQKQPTIA
ncbi:MAG: NAD(P)H-dependent oxidoreductase [Chloroflexi bacterium]|nr:MAG: NAD(P)H-dependent oxidoreductase [Chloroflexota bacterium]